MDSEVLLGALDLPIVRSAPLYLITNQFIRQVDKASQNLNAVEVLQQLLVLLGERHFHENAGSQVAQYEVIPLL